MNPIFNLLNRMLLLFTLTFWFNECFSSTYYFSESQGDDLRSIAEAQNSTTPWRSLNKLNAFMSSLRPGDEVLFKRGDVFEGYMSVNASGAAGNLITFAAYGQGSKPVITGFVKVSGWAHAQNGIWEANVPAPEINILLFNDVVQPKGRYPNASAPGNGYLTIESSAGQNQLTDEQLPGTPNWTGATVVTRKSRWVIDNDPITLHNGNTIEFLPSTGYSPVKGYGYFIQDHLLALDVPGEWYFNAPQQKIAVCFDASGPAQATVKAATGGHLVQLQGQAYLRFQSLRFEGANRNAFNLGNAHHIQVADCEIFYTGINAIDMDNSNHFQLEGCTINYTNNIALNANNCSNVSVRNNSIFATGIFAGMGQNNSGSYEGMILKGDNNIVEFNNIDSTGYIPITFDGDNVLIKNNFIRSFAFVKDDGGGIYTWNNLPGAAARSNRIITGNIILHGRGAGVGTDDPASAKVHGIYMDDNAGNTVISGNSIAHCGQYGIFIHNAYDIVMNNNTVYNNETQLVLAHDNTAQNALIRNIRSTNNILFSRLAEQRVAAFTTIDNDIGNFGYFDSNYYCRPLDDELVIFTSYRVNGVYNNAMIDLETWQALYNKDLHSSKSPVRIMPYRIDRIVSGNKYANGNFTTDINGLYVFSPGNNATASWANAAGLDNGALKLQFTSQSAAYNQAYIVIAIGAVSANSNYILRFSLKGGNDHKNMQAFLRQSLSPYNDLSARGFQPITATRTENEFLLTANASESDASIILEVEENASPVYFDNIQLFESDVTLTNPDDSIRFEYNASASAKTIALNGSYVDAKRNIYTGSINLPAYSSAVLIRLQQLPALPLQFLSFTGAKAIDRTNLQWATSRDATTGYYEIERSATGTAFNIIDRVPVNTNGIYTYKFSDLQPLNGSNYYRLHHTSATGHLYSRIIRIDYQRSNRPLQSLRNQDMLLHPNPATSALQVIINGAPILLPATITITSAAGVVARSFPVRLQDNQVTLDISFLRPGTYVLRFVCDGKALAKTFLKKG